jgi:uncharacterized protein (DUF1800 family)
MTISRSDAAHLLRRSGFGATDAAIASLAASADWTAAVDRVLDTSLAPAVVAPPSLAAGDPGSYERLVDVMQWWVRRMRTSPAPIVEKMTLFWHNHMPSAWAKHDDTNLLWRQHLTYRTHALGNYHDLVQAMAVDPWMLHYLDNGRSQAPGRINENFGREVMELFTLGNGQFGEGDVVAMSRAWSGHNLDAAGTGYLFDSSVHDASSKTLFGITRNWDGPDALTEILRGSKAEVSSAFLVAKLWSYLAAPNPPPALVADLALGFRASGLSIRALVRAIFLRPEFREAATRTALVRSPVEWFVALTGALGIDESHSHPEWWLPSMGQFLFNPPNVSGWKQNSYWMSSATWWRRGECASYLRWVATDLAYGYDALPDLSWTSTPTQVSAALFSLFGITDPSPATKAVIEGWVTGLAGTEERWSIRPHAIPLVALSPDFVLG